MIRFICFFLLFSILGKGIYFSLTNLSINKTKQTTELEMISDTDDFENNCFFSEDVEKDMDLDYVLNDSFYTFDKVKTLKNNNYGRSEKLKTLFYPPDSPPPNFIS